MPPPTLSVRKKYPMLNRVNVKTLTKESEKNTLSRAIRKDIMWLQIFMEKFAGVEKIISPNFCLSVLGDAYPQGGGNWNPTRAEYFSCRFPEYMCYADTPIHIEEFVVVLLCIRMWGQEWTGQRILIFCDIESVVET